MNGLKQMILAATRKARGARAVPLMVPHGGADSSSDFESAFEMLQGDDRARELWQREQNPVWACVLNSSRSRNQSP